MKIGKTLYVNNRRDWRKWLEKNYNKEKEIWLILYRKHTGKQSIPYNDAVEEALCFGWIDSIVKGINDEKYVQRYSPRKEKSQWSEMNKERVRRLLKLKKMTTAGKRFLPKDLMDELVIPKDILSTLQEDKEIWNNFQKYSESYKRIRIGWIDDVRVRPKEFRKRLAYFLKMTKKNKMFGMVQ